MIGLCEHNNAYSGSIKAGNFLDAYKATINFSRKIHNMEFVR